MLQSRALYTDLIKDQKSLVIERLEPILKFFKEEFEIIPSDETDLETIIYDKLPNVNIYVDYAVNGKIELEDVDVINSDDESLLGVEKILYSSIAEILDSINGYNEYSTALEMEHRHDIQFG